MNKKVLSLTLFLLSVLLFPVFASSAVPTIEGMVKAAEMTTLFIASGVVVILWVVTGLIFVTAQGAPEKINQGKKALFGAVAGTLLVIVAGSAVALVGQAFGL